MICFVSGKATSKGKLPDFKLVNPKGAKPKKEDSKTSNIVQDFLFAIGLDYQSRAFYMAVNYPFRAQAIKSAIAITGAPCIRGTFYPIQLVRALVSDPDGVLFNLITPFENDFTVKDAKTTKNVIGFNENKVFTFTDAKKNPEGSPELSGSVDHTDYCVDFVTENNGNVFVTNNFLTAKPPQKKQFAQTVAHNIAHQFGAFEQGFDCTCERKGPFGAENVCTVVHSKNKTTK